jgi:hypothetical protein
MAAQICRTAGAKKIDDNLPLGRSILPSGLSKIGHVMLFIS